MGSSLLARLLGSPSPQPAARLAFVAPARPNLSEKPTRRTAVAIGDICKAAAAADDYDSARVVAAFMNADAMKEAAMGRDPSGWTDTRVLALGRVFAEVFREQRSAPAPAARPVMPTVQTVFAPEPRSAPVEVTAADTEATYGDVGQAAVTEALRVVVNGEDHGG